MPDSQTLIQAYLTELNAKLATGNSTEHSHRPALQQLIESLSTGTTAINDPKRTSVGAPDFLIKKGEAITGHMEAKDIGKSLTDVEKSEQFKRYVSALSNVILTDYLEFRHYIDGKLHYQKSLGTLIDGKIKRHPESTQPVAELLINFLSLSAVKVGTPKELAVRMARMAHQIRNLIIGTLDAESEKGQLHSQLAAFRENLIPDLSHEQFADMYAQTIAYGLFAARCTMPEKEHFTRFDAAQHLPRTNPFLRKLFQHIAGYELDERIAWLVDELAQVLAQADMAAVLENFGKHTGKEDPVVHFYETFLKEYDPKTREMRGVYYTPEAVVSYIVRSVDRILKTRFKKPTGLADESVYILDPAVGTATFLYMVINEIHEAVVGAGQKGAWNDYVAKKLLPRLYGFELLMAPYAVAHLKLGLQLQETGYKFETDERLGIYLTNTLEEAFRKSEELAGFNAYIVDEANEAARIKKEEPIMVVLGNPPYSGISVNASTRTVVDPKTYKRKKELTWIGKLIEDYKVVDGQPLRERKHWLQDDYVKFLRFGQWRIKRTGKGILAFVTNHGYIDNPTFRGMRQSLIKTFNAIYILNLHGNSKKKEVSPDGSKDENVFDIQQGVSICLLIKEPDNTDPATVHYSDLWGSREEKYEVLSATNIAETKWKDVIPNSPFYFLNSSENQLNKSEYMHGWNTNEIFLINSTGIVTARDSVVVDFNIHELTRKIAEFATPTLSDEELRLKYFGSKREGRYLPGDTRGWQLSKARIKLRKEKTLSLAVKPYLYRPYDKRFIFYRNYMVDWPRPEVAHHMLAGPNQGLLITRQTRDQWDVFPTNTIVGHKSLSAYDITSFVPLYIYPSEGEMQFELGRRPNLNPEFVEDISSKLCMSFIPDGKGNLETTFGPEDVFNYAYAIFHSPTYRNRYAEFLKIDFPRLPLTSDKALFKALAEKGTELVGLHLMEAPALNKLITKYAIPGSNKVEKVTYDEALQRVYITKDQYFEGVKPEVWNFQVGGYQVAHKWLKDRKGRTLSYDDIVHYQRIVVALTETGRVMEEIDEVIPMWPIK
jgi:predicted helicase